MSVIARCLEAVSDFHRKTGRHLDSIALPKDLYAALAKEVEEQRINLTTLPNVWGIRLHSHSGYTEVVELRE